MIKNVFAANSIDGMEKIRYSKGQGLLSYPKKMSGLIGKFNKYSHRQTEKWKESEEQSEKKRQRLRRLWLSDAMLVSKTEIKTCKKL